MECIRDVHGMILVEAYFSPYPPDLICMVQILFRSAEKKENNGLNEYFHVNSMVRPWIQYYAIELGDKSCMPYAMERNMLISISII